MTEIIVRGFHLDGYGHVNNARYLEFLEAARWDYFSNILTLDFLQKKNLIYTVVNININYRREATLDQVLTVSCKLKQIRNRSFIIEQTIALKDSGEVVADALVTAVMVDTNTRRAVVIDDEIKAKLMQH